MKAIILAGGKGSRLHPLTAHYPKPLLSLLDKPVLEYNIELLRNHGIKDIAILIHHYGNEIRKYFGNGARLGVNITYYEDNPPLGTAGSIKQAELFTEDNMFIIFSGDVFTDFSLLEAIESHREKSPICTIFLTNANDTQSFGLVKLDSKGYIKHFIEKPKIQFQHPQLINTGIYIFSPRIFQYIPKNTFMDFGRDIFPKLLENDEKIYGYLAKGFWLDVGEIDRFHQASMDVLGKKINVTVCCKEVTPQMWIGDNVEIGERVNIQPPVYIGNNVRIGDDTTISPNSVIGSNSVIERDTVVEEASVLQSQYFLQKINSTSPSYKVSLRYTPLYNCNKTISNKN